MRRVALVLLILWVHLGDIVTAWLFADGAHPQAAQLRPLRDLLVIGMALLCLGCCRLPRLLWPPLLAYGGLALAYLLHGLLRGQAPGLAVGSLGTLIVPPLFVLCGYYAIRTDTEQRRTVLLLALLALASTLFGMWEIRHTEFWTEQLGFPAYISQLKGVMIGTRPDVGLPWNFYGGEELERRAAGLLAAPLAQGSFLAVTAVATLALWHRRAFWPSIAATLAMLVGVWASGTRGAMLVAVIALTGYVLSERSLLRSPIARLGVVALMLGLAGYASADIVQMTLQLRDGSSVGHWQALMTNLAQLEQVWLTGAGLGSQGALAAQQGVATVGGGEGALFSVAYQMGGPAALALLWFYLSCLRLLWHKHARRGDPLALAAFWLACGMTVTLVSSEHLLAVSGSAAFWLLLGGGLRSTPPAASPHLPASSSPAP